METLPRAGKPSRPPLERTTWEPDTTVRHLVTRAIVTWETWGILAIWNLYNEQITPRKRKLISEEDIEIQSHTSPMQRRHCPGQENAADHFSRGLLGNQIEPLDILWHGPSWLGKHEEYWPSGIFTKRKSPRREEKRPHSSSDGNDKC